VRWAWAWAASVPATNNAADKMARFLIMHLSNCFPAEPTRAVGRSSFPMFSILAFQTTGMAVEYSNAFSHSKK
jgi:hypothetical protein